MRKRDLRVGLHIKRVCDDGEEHGVTESYNGKLIMQCFSVYGGEGYWDIDEALKLDERGTLRRIKLVDRVYDPHER